MTKKNEPANEPENEPGRETELDFRSRLQKDPAATLTKLGVELLNEEVDKLRSSLKSLVERSLQTAGSNTAQHKVTALIEGKKIEVSLVLNITDGDNKN